MNERIKELARDAGFKSNDNQEVFLRVYEQELKKFAELIVRECIQQIQLSTARDPRDTAQYKQSVGHIRKIRKHFGIEE